MLKVFFNLKLIFFAILVSAIAHATDQITCDHPDHLADLEGEKVILLGQRATISGKHLIAKPEGFPHINYLDFKDEQIVVYTKTPIECRNILQVTGTVIRVTRKSKERRKWSHHYRTMVEYEIAADNTRCIKGKDGTVLGKKEYTYTIRECPEDSTRECQVDRVIDQIESEIGNLNVKYESGTIWDPPNRVPPDASTARKLGSWALLVPTYALRLATWPVALVGDLMVRKGVIRKVVNVVSNKERTRWVYPKIELGFGSGFGGGIGFRQYDLFGKDYIIGGSYQIHVNMNQEGYLSFGTPEAFELYDQKLGLNVRTDFMRHHRENYYGIGIEAPKSNEAKYGFDRFKLGGWTGYELFKHFSLRGQMYFEWNNSRGGSGGTSVEQMFPGSQIIGFGRDLYYLDIGLSLVHDNRDSDIIPQRGGRRRLMFDRFQGLGTAQYDYNEYRLELIQYFPVLMDRHVLVLRNDWRYQQQTGEGIPFYRLQKLDVWSVMRGYDYGRWSDRGLVVFNVEYRFPIWRFMDGQIFFDTGRVFHSPGDISFKHFKFDGGLGLRVRTENFFLIRFDFAYGNDGAKFLAKTSQAF